MAKQKRAIPARKPRDRSRDDESLLLRSAESLGRVIGLLQRQLDSATRRLSATTSDGRDVLPSLTGSTATPRRGTNKRGASAGTARAKKTKRVAKKAAPNSTRKNTRRR